MLRLAGAAAMVAAVWCAQGARAADAAVEGAWAFGAWEKLPTEPYRGKQDDISFVTPEVGWYVNGQGKLFSTTDGGRTWTKRVEMPGTFFRCVGFVDEELGFVGNVGTGYFPGVTDERPLFRTRDGGRTLEPVEVDAPALKGLCAIEVARYPFINAGVPGQKTLLAAAGRVGGPAWLLTSADLGETWSARDLSGECGMILDVHFFTDRIGLVAAASSSDVAESHALILRTEDGGATWTRVYESKRPYELTWKMHFPTRDVGYCTVQSYDPDPAASARFVAKTTDGGRTWKELPLVDDQRVREFGVAFVDERTGWVGAMPSGFQTTDGGATWAPVAFGNAVNKIRVLKGDLDGDGARDDFRAYAIGVEVHRLDGTLATP